MEEIKVIEIVEKDAFLIKRGRLSNYTKYLLNGNIIDSELTHQDIIIKKSDVFQTLKNSKEIIHYSRGEEIITVEYYESKPQNYSSESSEQETLRAIANRKELKDFEPVYKDPEPKDVKIIIVGYMVYSESNFIDSYVTGMYSSNEVLFTVNGREIAIDEYNKLSEKYSEYARFGKQNRNYLRFTQINNNYAFSDTKPFGDSDYRKSFISLEEAKKEEESIRKAVKYAVEKAVFHKDISKEKQLMILDNLKSIKKLKTLKSKNEMIDVLINDISDYLSYIS